MTKDKQLDITTQIAPLEKDYDADALVSFVEWFCNLNDDFPGWSVLQVDNEPDDLVDSQSETIFSDIAISWINYDIKILFYYSKYTPNCTSIKEYLHFLDVMRGAYDRTGKSFFDESDTEVEAYGVDAGEDDMLEWYSETMQQRHKLMTEDSSYTMVSPGIGAIVGATIGGYFMQGKQALGAGIGLIIGGLPGAQKGIAMMAEEVMETGKQAVNKTFQYLSIAAVVFTGVIVFKMSR